ncbi:glycerol-3-phosphate acyltransferase 2, mitochondrial-like isoform X2 [Rhea pennata]|uniref:glycerol-3-phosphate acyltransferase 2, mitochondrial-like isoform X2 n=1 Tax=Rhea pennata TaxID=8795 RepID=UPI002E25C09B
MKTWVCDLGQKLEIFTPFLGKYRPFVGRCCQTCTPRSWDCFYHEQFSSLGFRNIIRVREENTRYRGWLVRRLCYFLAVLDWKVPADAPGDLAERICRSKRVQDVAAGQARGSTGDGKSPLRWRDKVLKILAEIQAPLSLFMLRLCGWALLRLLNHLFLNVQLHRGQLEMVLRAARTPGVPLVFLSTHKSQLDGLLLSFVLFSQGLGVPRVTVGGQTCSRHLRALLSSLGGVFLPTRTERMRSGQDEELSGAVLAAYVEEVLKSQQPLLIFLEEPFSGTLHLSAPAWEWLALVYRALRDSAVSDVLLVPVGIAYDVAPDGHCAGQAHGARPLSLRACLWAACRALSQEFGCARVDFAQPFSLQEFVAKNLVRRSCAGKSLEELLLPTVLGTGSSQVDGNKAEVWGPGARTAAGLKPEEEILVTKLGLHALSDGVACSAVMAVGITSALLLHKHREGVFLSRLMSDFSWLLEEILLRHHDVGFSGQLRAVVPHSLSLLSARLALYRLSPPGDILVVPEASAVAQRELGLHSVALLPVFASEAVGACAIRALLVEMLPFLGVPAGPCGVVLSRDELHRKTLALLWLLPPNLLGLQPCQPLECYSQDVLDKLIRCGLLEAEESEREHQLCDVARRPFLRRPPWTEMDFADSDSDDEDNAGKRCFKLCQPRSSPDFLLFLCRLLSPVLKTYVRAAAFLDEASWPQPEPAYVDTLQRFLAEDGGFAYADGSLALSSLQTFKEMGVLKEVASPAGPLLHLGEPFRSRENREKLVAFIQQFAEP